MFWVVIEAVYAVTVNQTITVIEGPRHVETEMEKKLNNGGFVNA